jgi:hypothetical protein
MKRIVIASVVMMLLFALAAQAQTPPPGPEHKKLADFVGTWATEGKHEVTPWGGKAGTYKDTTACRWFAGEYQVICDVDATGPSGTYKSHMITGYSAQRKQYYSFSINSLGGSSQLRIMKVDGSTWTYEGSNTSTGKTYQIRFAGKFPSSKEWVYKWEYSEDGKNWKTYSEAKMTKR